MECQVIQYRILTSRQRRIPETTADIIYEILTCVKDTYMFLGNTFCSFFCRKFAHTHIHIYDMTYCVVVPVVI